MKGKFKMKNVIKTFVIALISILATIIVCNINTTTIAHAETYDIEAAYELVNKEMELYASCYDGETFNVDYDTACKIAQLEADFYSSTNRTETTTTTIEEEQTATTTTTIKEKQTTITTTTTTEQTTTTEEEQTTTTIEEEQTATEQQHYIECNQCREEANDYVNKTAEIYNSVFDGVNFNVDYDTACELVQAEFEYYSTSHEQHEQITEDSYTNPEEDLNSAYDYVNQITEIYANNYDGYNFNIDYDTACDIVQLEMEFYSK